MIGHFPLWMVLAVWLLQRRSPASVTVFNASRQRQMLEDMRRSLPVPRGRLEVWLVVRILGWIERELDAVRALQLAGLVATVLVSDNQAVGPFADGGRTVRAR